MAFESSKSYAGGTLTVSYSPESDQWFVRYTLPNGFSLTGSGSSPFQLGFNYGSSYDYDDVTKQLIRIIVNADPGTVITDPASISAWQQFVDITRDRSDAILELANDIARQRKAEIKAAEPSSVTGTESPAPNGTVVVDKPATIIDPSNPLPLGDAIDDIYDPNLTPEQIESLSPGDQFARAQELGYEYEGPPVTPGEVDEDGGITVTAEGEGDEIVVNGNIDWRVKLSLAPNSEYLYNSQYAGILEPLYDQNGVIFPYTPTINVNYVANYEPASIVHNNYKVYQYSNSAVDTVTLTCEFTAQDTKEARYLLAVIHFFKSMTKMFFGQDQLPRAGTPPPLCYLRGMGTFQFKNHPLAITSFTYNLPNDVDYISTTGASTTGSLISKNNQSSSLRLPPNILPGGVAPPPTFTAGLTEGIYDYTLTWVPTKIQMSITCVPMMSRNDVSNEFSLEGYASGDLYSDRGFW